MITEPGRTTLASVFQRGGYATGVVGTWHLGLGSAGGPDWNGEIRPGPADIGFDTAFIMPTTGDRVPTVNVENRHVRGLDPNDPIKVSYDDPLKGSATGRENPNLLKVHPSHGHDQTIVNWISRIGYMSGGRTALWKDEDMADVFARQGDRVYRAASRKAVLRVFRGARPSRAARAACALHSRHADGATRGRDSGRRGRRDGAAGRRHLLATKLRLRRVPRELKAGVVRV